MLIAAFRRWVLSLALLGLGLPRPCLAQPDAGPAGASPAPGLPSPGPLELTWVSSDPTCDGTTVTARALELVTPGVTPRPTQARAELSREGSSWIVDLQTRSESHAGRRVLRGESCKEIQQAIALLLAMILESEAKSAAAQALAPPAAPPVPPANTAPNTMLAPNAAAAAIADDEPPPPPAAPGPRFGWLLRSDATAALGLKPGLGLSAGVGAALSLGAVELAGGVAYWPTSRTQIFNGAGTLDVSRQTLTIAGCYRFSMGTLLQIVPCAGPEFSWYSYVSAGIDDTEEGTKLLVNGTATIEFRFGIVGPMFAALTPGVIWGKSQPFEGKECRDCNRTDVFHTWGIGPRLGAGVGARF